MAPIGAARANLSRVPSFIPDTSMFQSPLYQWNAGSGIGVSDGSEATNWEDQLASLTASAVGSPTFRADQSGFEAVEYGGASDGHDVPSDGQLPTGGSAVSFAATVYLNDTTDARVFSYGTDTDGQSAEFGIEDGSVSAETFAGTIRAQTSSTLSTGQWITIGGKLRDGDGAAFLNGADKATSSGSMDQPDNGRALGYRRWISDRYLNGFVYDAVVCAAYESDQAFSDYHNDRLG